MPEHNIRVFGIVLSGNPIAYPTCFTSRLVGVVSSCKELIISMRRDPDVVLGEWRARCDVRCGICETHL
jgi:hypothetical protein